MINRNEPISLTLIVSPVGSLLAYSPNHLFRHYAKSIARCGFFQQRSVHRVAPHEIQRLQRDEIAQRIALLQIGICQITRIGDRLAEMPPSGFRP